MRLWPQRKSPPSGEVRSGTQDWIDAFVRAADEGLLRTSMATLDEEQVTGSYAPLLKRNSAVWALVLARLQVFSQARFQWTRFQGAKPTDLFGTGSLRILEQPWPGGTTADLLARMELDVSASGNAYIRRITGRSTPDRLTRLRPEWMVVVLGSKENPEQPAIAADAEVVGYAYLPYGSSERALMLLPDEVAHYAPYPDPDFSFVGMSWITAALRDIYGDDLQTEHKRAFLRNAASPNFAITYDPAVQPEQVKVFKELMDSEHRGAWNAYKTLHLGGGAKPITVGTNFQQLEFTAVQGKAESRLAAAAGVPPSWVGFSEGLQGSALNAGNFNSARRRFSDGTMVHLWANAATSLQAIVPPPDPGATLWFDASGVAFMREDAGDLAAIQQHQASTIVALSNGGFTPESVVDAVTNNDFSRLVHSGLLSVQLREPGAGEPDQDTPADTSPNQGGQQ